MTSRIPACRPVPIGEILQVFLTAIRNALLAPGPVPGVIKRPAHLIDLVRKGEKRRRANEARLKIPVPRFCIFSVTWKCNLECAGCYAGNYVSCGSLDRHEIERIIREAAGLGSYIFLIAGGEPLEVPGIIDCMAGIPHVLFLLFTNGTTLDGGHARQLAGSANILPVISVDGDDAENDGRRGRGTADRIRAAMRLLRNAGVGFGFSAMVTRRNIGTVTSRAWMDDLWERGARLGFLIDYVPVGADADPAMVLTKKDLAFKAGAVRERKSEARPLVVNFPPDEYADGSGCLSGGNGLVHINADGFVEPCPFCHYAAENITEKPFREVLGSPFLSAVRETFGKNTEHAETCMLFKNSRLVEEIAASTGARRTDAIAAGNSSVPQARVEAP